MALANNFALWRQVFSSFAAPCSQANLVILRRRRPVPNFASWRFNPQISLRVLDDGRETSASEGQSNEANVLLDTIRSGGRKVLVFLGTVAVLIVIIGSMMYLVEGGGRGFESIPAGIYWAVVTLTTVGYGDIVPATALGKVCAAVVMITGFAILAVPFGIMTAELSARIKRPVSTQACKGCSREGHDSDAVHCKFCGAPL